MTEDEQFQIAKEHLAKCTGPDERRAVLLRLLKHASWTHARLVREGHAAADETVP